MPTKKITAIKKPGSPVYGTRNPDGTFATIPEAPSRAGTQSEKTARHAEPVHSPSEPRGAKPVKPSKEAILALAGKYQGASWWDEYEAAIEEVRSEQRADVAEG